ncbi:MAG: hypothetical protein ACRENU_13325 [Gemmatimonadaceae bacterium]
MLKLSGKSIASRREVSRDVQNIAILTGPRDRYRSFEIQCVGPDDHDRSEQRKGLPLEGCNAAHARWVGAKTPAYGPELHGTARAARSDNPDSGVDVVCVAIREDHSKVTFPLEAEEGASGNRVVRHT